MKKFLAVLLAVLMMVPMGTVAMAAENYTGPIVTVPDEFRYLTMGVGETLTIELEVLIPDKEYHVEWSSSNEEVATVDQNGKVTAHAPGRVTITALHDGYGPSSEITVYDDETYVFLSRKNPGEISRYAWSINSDDSCWNNFTLQKLGPDEVVDVTSKNSNNIFFKDVRGNTNDPTEKNYRVYYQLTPAEYELDDLDKEIEDSIIVTTKSGRTYEFPFVWVLTAYPYLSATPAFPEEIVLSPGETTTIHYEVIDKQECLESYDPKVTLLDDDDVTLGEIVKDGNKFSVSVTCMGEYFITYINGSADYQLKSQYQRYSGYFFLDKEIKVVDPYFSEEKPSKPTKPGSTGKESPEQAECTANKAAEDAAVDVIEEANAALAAGKELPAKAQSVTTAAGTTITAVPVKLSGLEASIYLDTMDLLATGKVGLKASINSGAAEVILPAGFKHDPEPGRFGYPLGFQKDPRDASLMTELVKGDTAKTETYKLGGNVVLPTTATVTIKTKLDGKVNIYYWNDETRKATLIASPTAADGRVTFATKQLGHLILTTGTI